MSINTDHSTSSHHEEHHVEEHHEAHHVEEHHEEHHLEDHHVEEHHQAHDAFEAHNDDHSAAGNAAPQAQHPAPSYRPEDHRLNSAAAWRPSGGDGFEPSRPRPSLTGGASAGFGSNPSTLSVGTSSASSKQPSVGFGNVTAGASSTPAVPPQQPQGTTASVINGLGTIANAFVSDPRGTLGVVANGLGGFTDANAWKQGLDNAGQFLGATGRSLGQHMFMDPAEALANTVRTGAATAQSTMNGLGVIASSMTTDPGRTLGVITNGLAGLGDTNAWAQGANDAGQFLLGVAKAPVDMVTGAAQQLQDFGAAASNVWNNGATSQNVAALGESTGALGTTAINGAMMVDGAVNLVKGAGNMLSGAPRPAPGVTQLALDGTEVPVAAEVPRQFPARLDSHGAQVPGTVRIPDDVTVSFTAAEGTNAAGATYEPFHPVDIARGGDLVPEMRFSPGDWASATPVENLPRTLSEYLSTAQPGEALTVDACRGLKPGPITIQTPDGVTRFRLDNAVVRQNPLFDLTPYTK